MKRAAIVAIAAAAVALLAPMASAYPPDKPPPGCIGHPQGTYKPICVSDILKP